MVKNLFVAESITEPNIVTDCCGNQNLYIPSSTATAETIRVGNTFTGQEGSHSSVVDVGTVSEHVLEFYIPVGNSAKTPVPKVGTVSQLPAGSTPTVEIVANQSGDSLVWTFNFGFPSCKEEG